MAPVRNNNRSIRRLSSPLLPNALLLSISMRQGTTNAKLRGAAEESLATEEAERLAMNDKVYACLEAALASPNNKEKRTVARWEEEDYEALYGKFVPEHATSAWLAKRDAAYDVLVEQRSGVVHALPIHQADDLRAYFAAEAAFERDFGTPFEVDDGEGHALHLKHHLLDHHRELMHRAHGDPGEAFKIAGEPFTYCVVNPYRSDDERRVEFDQKLRRMYAFYRIDGAAPRRPTLERLKFVFDLPNTYGKLDEQRLTYWCHCRIWKDDIDTLMADAKADAALPKPPPWAIPTSIFYGWGRFNASRVSLHARSIAKSAGVVAMGCTHVAKSAGTSLRRLHKAYTYRRAYAPAAAADETNHLIWKYQESAYGNFPNRGSTAAASLTMTATVSTPDGGTTRRRRPPMQHDSSAPAISSSAPIRTCALALYAVATRGLHPRSYGILPQPGPVSRAQL
ncbi:hypothetical protein FB451DRAFT_1410433 [Mycena latifolia]|nr:hypothetical protein FB451DRAFT_1410433 [Mycena latifolia]